MSSSDSSLSTGVFVVLAAVYVLIAIVFIWAYVRIIRRSGYSGWWVLIGLVPVLNVIMFLVFAFKTSPAERELAHLRAMVYQRPPG